MTTEVAPELRHGRCPTCGHGEVVGTVPVVTIEGTKSEVFAISNVSLELWTCTRCGLSQLAVREPEKIAQHPSGHARRVLAEPPLGTFDVRIVREVPSEGAVRVSIETKVARLLGIDYRRASTLLDGPLPITLARNLDWNAAEHARALAARINLTVEIAPSEPAGYR